MPSLKRIPPKQSPPRNSSKKCFYCSNPGTTRDHVPARAIFDKTRPKKIAPTTLPCCAICNNQFGKDEEFFLVFLAMTSNSRYFPENRKKRIRKRYDRLTRTVRKSFRVSRNGVLYFLPEALRRFSRVAKKYAIGAYWQQYGEEIKPGGIYDVNVYHVSNLPEDVQSVIETATFGMDKWYVLQRGVFSYVFVKSLAPKNYRWIIFNIYKTMFMKVVIPVQQSFFPKRGFRKRVEYVSDDQLKLALPNPI